MSRTLLFHEDFPVFAIGAHVYRKTQSSPLLTTSSMQMAAEIALRLNRDDTCYPSPSINQTIVEIG